MNNNFPIIPVSAGGFLQRDNLASRPLAVLPHFRQGSDRLNGSQMTLIRPSGLALALRAHGCTATALQIRLRDIDSPNDSALQRGRLSFPFHGQGSPCCFLSFVPHRARPGSSGHGPAFAIDMVLPPCRPLAASPSAAPWPARSFHLTAYFSPLLARWLWPMARCGSAEAAPPLSRRPCAVLLRLPSAARFCAGT